MAWADYIKAATKAKVSVLVDGAVYENDIN